MVLQMIFCPQNNDARFCSSNEFLTLLLRTAAQPAKSDLNEKSFPKQKTIQNFTIDAQIKKWKSSHMGNGSYQLNSAGRSANHGLFI